MARLARQESTTDSALALIAQPSSWPSSRRYPGLAHGWQGAAWVAFQLASAGIRVPDRVFASIGQRVCRAPDRPPPGDRVGALIGCAADAVVAAYAVRQGIVHRTVARSVSQRVAAAARASDAWDVHMGLAGALLAFSEIAAVEPSALSAGPLRQLARRLVRRVDALSALPPRGWPTGMAHGLAGAIMAAESCSAAGWCRVTTAHRQRWLDALSGCAVSIDGAVLWPAIAGQRALGLQSWCAGTPGIALALLQCFRLTREPAYLEFARAALDGMLALASKRFHSTTLCCGSGGFRHILLEAHRVTGDGGWLAAAARKPRLSPSTRRRLRRGLLQGELGLAYLAARRDHPQALPLPGLGTTSAR